jgi:hypothetical protein
MAIKVSVWDTPEKQQLELARRLKNAMQARIDVERGWREAERVIFTIQNVDESGSEKTALGDGTGIDSTFNAQPRVAVNTAFKNYRFLHSQMSANPPTVVCRPTSGDQKDEQAADAADRLIRFAIRHYQLQEHTDRCTGHVLLYGTGFMKLVWNPDAGEVLEFDEATMEATCDGDIEVSVPVPWNMFLDPDAETWESVRYVFERMYIPYEEACLMFPDKEDLLQKLRSKSQGTSAPTQPLESEPTPTFLKQFHFDSVEIYQYWETGLAVNGMQGRFTYCSVSGEPLQDMQLNPFRFASIKNKTGDGLQKGLPRAYLPYSMMTDVDNPTSLWGRSSVVYAGPLQDIHNALVNTMIENARAHGVARLLCHEDTELADDSITNSPYDIVRWTGSRPPEYQPPMAMPAVMNDLIGLMAKGIDDMYGTNEAMFGQQSREQSGFSMQYSTQQGNLIRRRLFNKYTSMVETTYRHFLDLVRKHWEVEKTITVLGKEKAFEALDIKGADIEGGFDLVVEYGASLSLDPVSRRQELIQLMPLFEKAQVDPRDLMRHLKLSELEGAYDLVQMAADRQREIFDEIIATGKAIPPKPKMDHTGMLRFAYGYLMGSTFRDLDPTLQKLIEDHVSAREQLAASDAQKAAGAGVGPGGALPPPGALQPGGTPPGPQTPGNAAALGQALPTPPGGTGQQTTTSQGLQPANG